MSANNETKNNEVEEDVKIEDEPEDQNNHLDNEKARAAKVKFHIIQIFYSLILLSSDRV